MTYKLHLQNNEEVLLKGFLLLLGLTIHILYN